MDVLAGHALDAEVDDAVGEEQRVADGDLGGGAARTRRTRNHGSP
jgi:hypothetical protein